MHCAPWVSGDTPQGGIGASAPGLGSDFVSLVLDGRLPGLSLLGIGWGLFRPGALVRTRRTSALPGPRGEAAGQQDGTSGSSREDRLGRRPPWPPLDSLLC